MKKILKITSVVLSALLVFYAIYEGVLAAPFPVRRVIGGDGNNIGAYNNALDRGNIEDEEYDALILGEVVELREEYVRHYAGGQLGAL